MNAPLKRTTILLSMLSLLALPGCGKAPPPAPGPPEVGVAKVISKRIQDWDEYTGRFQAIDTVEVRPRASGYVDQVLFREGQFVKKDEVLVVIDPRPYQADFDRAQGRPRARQIATRAGESRGGARAEAQGLRRRLARGAR